MLAVLTKAEAKHLTKVQALTRLEELSEAHRLRVFAMMKKERAMDYAPGQTYATNESAKEYRLTLESVQKFRFDLGLDEFRGPGSQIALKGTTHTVSLPDGTNLQKQVFEAVNTIEKIFEQRGIPKVSVER